MTTLNSATTGHNRRQERHFANKLFLGLIMAVIVAFSIAFFTSRRAESPTTLSQPTIDSGNSTEAPLAPSSQPRN